MTGYIGFTEAFTGEVAGSVTAAQLPAALRRSCKRVLIRARSDNGADSVYIGFDPGVTVPDGASDATTGIEITAGDPPLMLDIPHTDQIWYICSAATADFTICILS
jgi:hypothetical protein